MHVVATAGHVDHGKSTLVRALTGTEPDRWDEEKQRGLTIDLGFAWTELPSGTHVAFVDVPGHERFLGNMLAGVGPAPVVCFVVAADEGWQEQSGDHRDAVAALGITPVSYTHLAVYKRQPLHGQQLARPAHQVDGHHGGAAHGVDVREGVGRGDPAPVVGAVHHGREEVRRGHHREVGAHEHGRGVVAVVQAHQDVRRVLTGQPADRVLQLSRGDLARAASAVGVAREAAETGCGVLGGGVRGAFTHGASVGTRSDSMLSMRVPGR